MAPPQFLEIYLLEQCKTNLSFLLNIKKYHQAFPKIILIISNPVWAELDTGVYKQSVYQGERGWVWMPWEKEISSAKQCFFESIFL